MVESLWVRSACFHSAAGSDSRAAKPETGSAIVPIYSSGCGDMFSVVAALPLLRPSLLVPPIRAGIRGNCVTASRSRGLLASDGPPGMGSLALEASRTASPTAHPFERVVVLVPRALLYVHCLRFPAIRT